MWSPCCGKDSSEDDREENRPGSVLSFGQNQPWPQGSKSQGAEPGPATPLTPTPQTPVSKTPVPRTPPQKTPASKSSTPKTPEGPIELQHLNSPGRGPPPQRPRRQENTPWYVAEPLPPPVRPIRREGTPDFIAEPPELPTPPRRAAPAIVVSPASRAKAQFELFAQASGTQPVEGGRTPPRPPTPHGHPAIQRPAITYDERGIQRPKTPDRQRQVRFAPAEAQPPIPRPQAANREGAPAPRPPIANRDRPVFPPGSPNPSGSGLSIPIGIDFDVNSNTRRPASPPRPSAPGPCESTSTVDTEFLNVSGDEEGGDDIGQRTSDALREAFYEPRVYPWEQPRPPQGQGHRRDRSGR